MINPINKPFFQQTKVDQVINRVIINNDKDVTQEMLDQVYVVAQVEEGIAKFRAQGEKMTAEEIEKETHNSQRLSSNMAKMGDPRPSEYCDAHAIISGGDARAETLRLYLVQFGVRKDDPVNGCWLPRRTKYLPYMPRRLINAVPHSRIHRNNYYVWLDRDVFTPTQVKSVDDFRRILVQVQFKLQTKTFPTFVMKPSGQE